MVCRDATTHKAAPVNPLKLSTNEEKQLFALGESKPRISPCSMLVFVTAPHSSQAPPSYALVCIAGSCSTDLARSGGAALGLLEVWELWERRRKQ